MGISRYPAFPAPSVVREGAFSNAKPGRRSRDRRRLSTMRATSSGGAMQASDWLITIRQRGKDVVVTLALAIGRSLFVVLLFVALFNQPLVEDPVTTD